MIVRATGNDVQSSPDERRRECLRVRDDLTRVQLEGRIEGFLQRDRLGGNPVLERPACVRENAWLSIASACSAYNR